MIHNSAIVIGAGIVGLATARALSLKGYKVTVIEKSSQPLGASIRNFGMIWPIGQPDGTLYQRALRSRDIWKEILTETKGDFDPCGSLHLAYSQEEHAVLEELYDHFSNHKRPVRLMTSDDISQKYNGINHTNLQSALFSADEMIIDPRQGMKHASAYLESSLGVDFIWGAAVTNVESNTVWCSNTSYHSDLICICSGSDFETLYPTIFKSLPITRTKLQMMRFVSSDPNFKMGTSICGGLSLLHYKSFLASASLDKLRIKLESEFPEHIAHGIHVMAAQNSKGELTIGDSHEYGSDFAPFDSNHVNQLILDYLRNMMHIGDWQLQQTWNGVYPKMTNDTTELFMKVNDGVYIINGIGGNGMTLSFGFAEEVIEKI
jgi:FAD dependent oxidoreductase TIGR03364